MGCRLTTRDDEPAIAGDVPLLDRLVADGLRKERLTDARRSDQQHVLRFADEATGRELEDLGALDGRVESEDEVIERLQLAEVGGLT